MPKTSKMGYEYPPENQPNWYSIFKAMINRIDADVFLGIENPCLVLTGGGTITLNSGADTLEWTEDFHLLSTLSGGDMTISANVLTGFEDGKIAYVEVARPVEGSKILTIGVGDSIGDNYNKVFLALRRGTNVVFRNLVG
jgi:hypothetical protein